MSGGSQALLNHSMINSNTILHVPNPIARTPEKTRNIDAKTRSDGGVNPDVADTTSRQVFILIVVLTAR